MRIRVHVEDDYRAHLGDAHSRLAGRDPDDAHPLALARTLGLPLWSNDKDLDGHGVPRYTTARLLTILEEQSAGR